MGEVADDMLDGTTCCVCGQFYRDDDRKVDGHTALFTHGYPAACWRCWQKMTKKERKNHLRALKPTL